MADELDSALTPVPLGYAKPSKAAPAFSPALTRLLLGSALVYAGTLAYDEVTLGPFEAGVVLYPLIGWAIKLTVVAALFRLGWAVRRYWSTRHLLERNGIATVGTGVGVGLADISVAAVGAFPATQWHILTVILGHLLLAAVSPWWVFKPGDL